MKTYVLFHKSCKDGFGAAWAAATKLGFPSKDLRYIAVAYDEAPPEIEDGSTVYIIDFSYPRDVLLKMKEKASSLLVLDHHKTAEEALRGLDFCTFDMNRSGAMLAWNYFNPDREPPDLIKYVQDRDLWKFELPDSEAYSAGLAVHDMSFEQWSILALPMFTKKLIETGNTLLAYQRKQVSIASIHVHIAEIGGHRVPVVNSPLLVSEIGNALCKQFPKYPFAAAYHVDETMRKKWSLRSLGFDVGAVAKEYGGGGHQQASGFMEQPGVGRPITFDVMPRPEGERRLHGREV
jgi:hypothetical protein